MANRQNFYFEQRVASEELNEAFDQLEASIHLLTSDLQVRGLISGGVVSEHRPVPDLSVDVSTPLVAYNQRGERIFIGTDLNLDLSVTSLGIPTEVNTPGNERWVAVFVRFTRRLEDERIDGNQQTVFFRNFEHYEVIVTMGAEGVAGGAPRAALDPEGLLLCDVRLKPGQGQITNIDIDTSRRQAFVFASSQAVSVDPSVWQALSVPGGNNPTVQAAFDTLDQMLSSHFDGTGFRHNAEQIDVTPPRGLVARTLQALWGEFWGQLRSTVGSAPGTSIIGSAAIPGTPLALAGSFLSAQLTRIVDFLNAHVGATSDAHQASAISFTAHDIINASNNVQSAIQELWNPLRSDANPQLGANLIGNTTLSGTPYNVSLRTVRQQLAQLLQHINNHTRADDHDGRYALLSHNHDDRYLRQVLAAFPKLTPGQTQIVATLEREPDEVSVGYALDANGLPAQTLYVNGGNYADQVWVEVLKITNSGDTDFRVIARNFSPVTLWVSIRVHMED